MQKSGDGSGRKKSYEIVTSLALKRQRSKIRNLDIIHSGIFVQIGFKGIDKDQILKCIHKQKLHVAKNEKRMRKIYSDSIFIIHLILWFSSF